MGTPGFDELILRDVSAFCHDGALEAFQERDAISLLLAVDSVGRLRFVHENARVLQGAGMFEAALVHAYTVTSTDNSGWPLRDLEVYSKCAPRGG